MPGITFDGPSLDEISDAIDEVNVLHGKSTWNEDAKFDADKDKSQFRNYEAACDRVKAFYKEQHEKQTVAFNLKAREDFKKKVRARMGIWEAMELLNTVVDDSDPDTSVSQMEHLLQTAEAIRRDGKPEWMQATGLVHDLGKLLQIFGSEGQWDVVGDTFVVGCKFSESIIYPDTFVNNADFYDPIYSTKYGIYKPNCGLDNVMLSWGHDEYLYNVLKCQSSLPDEGLAMIRYHSFYPWHRENAYHHLTNDKDEKILAAQISDHIMNPSLQNSSLPSLIGDLLYLLSHDIEFAIANYLVKHRHRYGCNIDVTGGTKLFSSVVRKSTLPYPPIHKGKKFVVLSDWDGTITTFDSNDYMTDNLGYGKVKRRQGNLDILSGKVTFRDAFREMLDSVAERHTFEECKTILKRDIRMDAGFRDFYTWCKNNDIPVVIVSSGMAPLIRAVLSNLIGEENSKQIDIVSNDVKVDSNGRWQIMYRHPTSGFGHDKSQAILPYRELSEPPMLFFFGDGVSDLSAARHADVLFVKDKEDGENDLAAYCVREGIPHIMFKSFSDALSVVQSIVRGEKTKEEAFALSAA